MNRYVGTRIYDAEGERLICPGCGWGLAADDGYCHNCEPPVGDYGYELECTHCGGEGTCDDGADPLNTCPEHVHRCHACNGSGDRKDQVVF